MPLRTLHAFRVAGAEALSILGAWSRDTTGSAAIVFSLLVPVLLGVAGASVEYASLAKRRTELQSAADEGALIGARELSLAKSEAYVSKLTSDLVKATARPSDPAKLDVQTRVLTSTRQVKVTASERVTTLMGRLVSYPEAAISVTATAQLSGAKKLCMLSLDDKTAGALHIHKNASVTADTCTLYSDSRDKGGFEIEDGALVTASLVCSSGGFKRGNSARLSSQPVTDCPFFPDPLASRSPPPLPGCDRTALVIDGKRTPSLFLAPGVYCGGLKITNGAQVTVSGGIYVIDNGPLVVDHGASLSGTYVGFYFTGDKGGLLFDVDSTISLTAPKDGPMAGLLFFENRTVKAPTVIDSLLKALPPPPPPGSPPMRQYRIISNDARNLLGTIYLPAGRLIVDSSKPVADRSAYTVVVARQIELFDGPNLYLNTNYGGTDIPVPKGVGPTTASALSLVK